MAAEILGQKTKIPGILGIEYGEKNVKENLEWGYTQYTHVFMLTFTNDKTRDAF